MGKDTKTTSVMKLPYKNKLGRNETISPGVGQYNISQSIDFCSKKFPQFKIGSSKRLE